MKDILIITNYYPPETGAASNRIFHLAEGLKNENYSVSILTPLPNYPHGKIFKGYSGKFSSKTVENDITVNRLWIYASNSKNKLLRLLAMVSYSFSLIWYFIRYNIPKTVIVQSPPLLVAFTSMLFLRSKKRKLILNVSDLWPLAGLELNALNKGLGYRLLEKIERFNYKHASIILCQSKEIVAHVNSLLPDKLTVLYRNYPVFETYEIAEETNNSNKIKVVYAGLLGIAQGVYRLIQELNFKNIELHIYGAGAEKELIEAYIKKNPDIPITYHGELKRSLLHKELIKYDLAIIPLLNRIYGSVPSKIFEYAKLGLPILYFGGGEGENIIKENNLGWVVEATNYDQLNETLSKIELSELQFDTKKRIKKIALEKFQLKPQIMALTKYL